MVRQNKKELTVKGLHRRLMTELENTKNKNMMTFSKTDKSLTVVIVENGKNTVLTTTSSNPRWNDILLALKNQDQSELETLMSVVKQVEQYTEANVVVSDGNVFFKNRPLAGPDVSRMLEFIRDGIPFLPLARFLERKHNNPSYRSINELYKFLEHRNMPLTPRGTILGYKGVREDFYSIMGNTATIMVSGETDSGGHILNTVGADIRCERSCVCDDYQQGCSPGLHIGSLEYAVGWGPKVLIVEFDPADVVSVPDDCNCQKLRACAYKVVGVYTGPMPNTYTESYESDVDDGMLDDAIESAGSCDAGCCDGNCDNLTDGADDEVDGDADAFDDGYQQGLKDGKSHKARAHFVTDLDDNDLSDKEYAYIQGYNEAYSYGRYGKGKGKGK